MLDNKNCGCLIIAEAGVNHNGRLDLALKLCDAAKEAGADVVKFQTWQTDKIITKNVAQAEYQVKNTGVEESQYDMLKKLELSYEDFRTIKKHCDKIGIIFSSTPDDEESADFLVELGVPFLKIGSGDICNISYLRYLGGKKLPIILSTGMSTLSDVDISISALREGGAEDITILHCTTSYPCSYENVNLRSMISLGQALKLPIGYSDHTMGRDVSVAAVALGATVIEKHFTIDRNMEGPDHVASMEPKEFADMVNSIRCVEKCLGCGIKTPTEAESKIAKVVTKRIVASRKIKRGELLSSKNLCVKRNDSGMEARYWDIVVNRKADRCYDIDEGIVI